MHVENFTSIFITARRCIFLSFKIFLKILCKYIQLCLSFFPNRHRMQLIADALAERFIRIWSYFQTIKGRQFTKQFSFLATYFSHQCYLISHATSHIQKFEFSLYSYSFSLVTHWKCAFCSYFSIMWCVGPCQRTIYGSPHTLFHNCLCFTRAK